MNATTISLYDVIYGEKKLTLVFEYLDTDLRKFIDNYPEQLNLNLIRVGSSSVYFTIEHRVLMFDLLMHIKKLMIQLLNGVAYCHEQKVFHRDLKPQ